MKKYLFGALLALFALTACTDNDTENINPGESSMGLNETITYFPTFENFVTRNVKHYENNMIVSDSTFDNSGNLLTYNIHEVNGNVYTITTKDVFNTTIATVIALHDDQGRLTDYGNGNIQFKYTYNGNSISVGLRDEPSEPYDEIGAFTLNEDGYIVSQTHLNGNMILSANSLLFNGDKPVSFMVQGTTGPLEQTGAFTYYPNSVPSNLSKSVTEINNEVLKTNRLASIGEFSNHHLENFTLNDSVYYHSQTEFNPAAGYEGYPQTQDITISGQPFCYIHYIFNN